MTSLNSFREPWYMMLFLVVWFLSWGEQSRIIVALSLSPVELVLRVKVL